MQAAPPAPGTTRLQPRRACPAAPVATASVMASVHRVRETILLQLPKACPAAAVTGLPVRRQRDRADRVRLQARAVPAPVLRVRVRPVRVLRVRVLPVRAAVPALPVRAAVPAAHVRPRA